RDLRHRRAVDGGRAGALLEARAVRELAQRAAVRVVGRAGHRPVRSLGRRVLADAGLVARPLTRGVRALGPADAGVEVVWVALGLAAAGERERVLVRHRVADLGVPDLLLHQDAALECGPRHLVLLGRGAVLGVPGVRDAGAVAHVGVGKAVRRAGGHRPGLMGGQISDRRREAPRRVGDGDPENVAAVDLQRAGVRGERADVGLLRVGRAGGDAVGLQVGEVNWLDAVAVAVTGNVALEAVDVQRRTPLGRTAAHAVDERSVARRVQL